MCVLMHVTTNSNKEMLIRYCEFRSTRMTKMNEQQYTQYGVKLMSRLYKVHQHIKGNIYITFTNILIQTQM